MLPARNFSVASAMVPLPSSGADIVRILTRCRATRMTLIKIALHASVARGISSSLMVNQCNLHMLYWLQRGEVTYFVILI